MKKLFNISAALAIMLMARGLASCSSNAEPEPAPEKMVEVTFKAQLPSRIDARAIADGTKANELFFYVYDENNNNIAALNRHNVAFDPTGEASVTVALTAGHTYSFAFWAQAKGVTVYDPSSASTVSLDYGSERKPVAGNDDLRDAFYSLEKNVTVAADGTTVTRKIVLRRALCQLNWAIDPALVRQMKEAGVDIDGALVKVSVSKAYNRFGLLEGAPVQLDNYSQPTFDYALQPAEQLTHIYDAASEDYKNFRWLAFDYFLTSTAQPSLIDARLTIKCLDGTVLGPYEVSNKKVQGNHRTNIILTGTLAEVHVNVVIDQDFDTPDNNVGAAPAWKAAAGHHRLTHIEWK